MGQLHTAELIPVLKAIHADVNCTPFMSDWFRDRGEDEAADLLRFSFAKGEEAVSSLACGATRGGRVFRPHDGCRRAVIEEAMGQLGYFRFSDHDIMLLKNELQYRREVREMLLVRPLDQWNVIPPDPRWNPNQSAKYTCVSSDGLLSKRVTLKLVKVNWEPPVVTLCGGWIEYTLPVWAGVDPLANRVVMTRPEPSLARDPKLREVPF